MARDKPGLPPVVVVVREGPPTPVQAQAWQRLWRLLISKGEQGPAQPAPAREGGKDA